MPNKYDCIPSGDTWSVAYAGKDAFEDHCDKAAEAEWSVPGATSSLAL